MKELIEYVKENYENLGAYAKDGVEAVWIASSDNADSYEVDEEWLGVQKDGTVMWAYASGCSCWDGDYSTTPLDEKTIKTSKFNHQEMQDGWEDAIKKFMEKNEVVIL